MSTPRRQIKREARREEKALKAAVLDKVTICCFWRLILLASLYFWGSHDSVGSFVQQIETELLERLKKGIYGDIYNYSETVWNKVLGEEKNVEEEVEEEEEEVLLYKLVIFSSPFNLDAASFYWSLFVKIISQEGLIEYVEGDDELEEEEEEDIEDFYGFPSEESHLEDDDHGKKNSSSFCFLLFSWILLLMISCRFSLYHQPYM